MDTFTDAEAIGKSATRPKETRAEAWPMDVTGLRQRPADPEGRVRSRNLAWLQPLRWAFWRSLRRPFSKKRGVRRAFAALASKLALAPKVRLRFGLRSPICRAIPQADFCGSCSRFRSGGEARFAVSRSAEAQPDKDSFHGIA
jgi:hypothetical protein